MEYGTVIDKKQRYVNKVGGLKNDNHNRYVLYEATESTFETVLFSEKNLQSIGNKVSEKMACLGRPVVLTMKTISSAVSSVLNTYQPQLGDIFSIYHIPAKECRHDMLTVNEQATELIYKQLKTEFGLESAARIRWEQLANTLWSLATLGWQGGEGSMRCWETEIRTARPPRGLSWAALAKQVLANWQTYR